VWTAFIWFSIGVSSGYTVVYLTVPQTAGDFLTSGVTELLKKHCSMECVS